MNRHEFDILLQKYLAGECSEEEWELVETWSDQMLLQSKVHLSQSEQDFLRKRLWKKLRKGSLGGGTLWDRFSPFTWSLAASVIIISLVGFGTFWYGVQREKQEERFAYRQIAAEVNEGTVTVQSEGKEQTVLLEDGSLVALGKESSIRYPVKFEGDTRKVYLTGNAFFKVKKDAHRPFLVFSGDLVTKVLGTSFNIRSLAKTGKIEVEVVSGSVSVYENNGSLSSSLDAIILTPNQKIVFEKGIQNPIPELVDEPVLIQETKGEDEMVFEDKLLPEVLLQVSGVFEIDIIVDSPALKSCRFTGDLGGLPLHTQLKLICRSVNGSYELQGNTYVLSGDGCITTD